MHVVLEQERESFRLADFDAYFRRIRGRLVEFVAEEPETYPWPVEHCSICAFAARCNAQWDADDHLTRVAWIGRGQIARLGEAGITTLEALGDAPADTEVEQMAPRTFETLRHQAALQLGHRRTGEHRYDLLEPVPERAPRPAAPAVRRRPLPRLRGRPVLHRRARARVPDRADGHERRLHRDLGAQLRGGARRVRAADRPPARAARCRPRLHVYHYAPYELTALRRLAAQYATREEELDELLRREVFVDLFAVVRQALRHSHPRYSIKNVRQFFMTAEADLAGGVDAIVDYERWPRRATTRCSRRSSATTRRTASRRCGSATGSSD